MTSPFKASRTLARSPPAGETWRSTSEERKENDTLQSNRATDVVQRLTKPLSQHLASPVRSGTTKTLASPLLRQDRIDRLATPKQRRQPASSRDAPLPPKSPFRTPRAKQTVATPWTGEKQQSMRRQAGHASPTRGKSPKSTAHVAALFPAVDGDHSSSSSSDASPLHAAREWQSSSPTIPSPLGLALPSQQQEEVKMASPLRQSFPPQTPSMQTPSLRRMPDPHSSPAAVSTPDTPFATLNRLFSANEADLMDEKAPESLLTITPTQGPAREATPSTPVVPLASSHRAFPPTPGALRLSALSPKTAQKSRYHLPTASVEKVHHVHHDVDPAHATLTAEDTEDEPMEQNQDTVDGEDEQSQDTVDGEEEQGLQEGMGEEEDQVPHEQEQEEEEEERAPSPPPVVKAPLCSPLRLSATQVDHLLRRESNEAIFDTLRRLVKGCHLAEWTTLLDDDI